MPFIYVTGMPAEAEKLEPLIEDIQKAAASIKELKLEPDNFIVFFPADLVQEGIGEELVIKIDCLFAMLERIQVVRQRLVDAVNQVLDSYAKIHLSQCSLVWVSQRPFVDKIDDKLGDDQTVSVYARSNPQES